MVYIKVRKPNSCKVHSIFNWNDSFFIKDGTIIQLFQNGELIGNCRIVKNWISYYVIHPDYRGCGYGGILLREAEKYIRRKYTKSFLIPQDNDEDLVEFYSYNGYIHCMDKNDTNYIEEDKYCWKMYKRLR